MSGVAVLPCLTHLLVHRKGTKRDAKEIGSDCLMVKSIRLSVAHLLLKTELNTS